MIQRGAALCCAILAVGITLAAAQPLKTVSQLRASGWDFSRRTQDNIQLLNRAFALTEFEAPPVIQDAMLDQLLRAGVPADNFYGCKVLETAARTRRIDVVRRMLAASAPPRAPPGLGYSMECNALSQGVEGGDPAIVSLLLTRHPDPNFGHYPALGMVISAPGYVPGDLGQGMETRIREGIARRPELVRLLLQAGADPRVKGGLPRTPEYYLRGLHNPEIDRLLDGWLAAHPA